MASPGLEAMDDYYTIVQSVVDGGATRQHLLRQMPFHFHFTGAKIEAQRN